MTRPHTIVWQKVNCPDRMRVAAEMAEAEGEIIDGGHQPFDAWITGLDG